MSWYTFYSNHFSNLLGLGWLCKILGIVVKRGDQNLNRGEGRSRAKRGTTHYKGGTGDPGWSHVICWQLPPSFPLSKMSSPCGGDSSENFNYPCTRVAWKQHLRNRGLTGNEPELWSFFHDTSTILLILVIRGHFSLRINPFLLPTLVLLQSNAPRVASKQFYVYACRSNCHRWNLMGIFSSNKVEVSTYSFEYTLTFFMGVKHFYSASNVAYKQQQQFWSISPKTIPARGWACHQWWKALCNNNLHILNIIITQEVSQPELYPCK